MPMLGIPSGESFVIRRLTAVMCCVQFANAGCVEKSGCEASQLVTLPAFGTSVHISFTFSSTYHAKNWISGAGFVVWEFAAVSAAECRGCEMLPSLWGSEQHAGC